ncbi:DUF1573 domain-containing protein [uncultured Aquimarina sp.]|uniref:DUF1573 domain-containing protein n=1 Tax=uncultured Aquimarina sp. TaxID=575652 RepID=UPI002609A9D8|nr:DUF1573 domain-containing protein [uncultured Aquimarina sp.]
MKTTNPFLILLIIASGLIISCTNQTKENTTTATMAMQGDSASETENAVPVMTFSETEFDFGTVTEGDILKHTFSFTNTGNAPLVIVNAKGSCGCTVSDWPKEPIAPGETKEMQVAFNTNGKPNLQNKQVTITTNTALGKHILKIKAMVTPKAKSVASGAPISK